MRSVGHWAGGGILLTFSTVRGVDGGGSNLASWALSAEGNLARSDLTSVGADGVVEGCDIPPVPGSNLRVEREPGIEGFEPMEKPEGGDTRGPPEGEDFWRGGTA